MDLHDGLDETAARLEHEADAKVDDRMFDLGGDERRMHVRAYNHWVSLLKGRPYPSIEALEPDRLADFGPHGVLLDFAGNATDPRIAYLGRALREECGVDAAIRRIADVPGRSLLSRLTDHHLEIIANRAPIGFEAEFVGTRGRTTLYRGILMPFASAGGDAIDFIYGVINWKEVADPIVQATIGAELEQAIRAAPAPSGDAPIWADGPGATAVDDLEPFPPGSLADTPTARGTIAAPALADRAVLARVPLAVEVAAGVAVVLVARMGADGVLDIVASVADEALAVRALERLERRRPDARA